MRSQIQSLLFTAQLLAGALAVAAPAADIAIKVESASADR
jgi:hypothetical protein